MQFFFKNAHYNIIKYYRKKINYLLEHNFSLTSYEVLSISTKMDKHICKHINLDNIIMIPRKLHNKVFKLQLNLNQNAYDLRYKR